MAQLGRIQITILNSTGDVTPNGLAEIRPQGATVNGGVTISSGDPVTIHDPGAIVNTDVCEVWNRDFQSGTGTTKRASTIGATTSFTAGSVTATTMVLTGFSGTLTLTDGDRITISAPATPLTLYKTAFGTGTFGSNILTSDSSGRAYAYVTGGFYDHVDSGTGITTTLFSDTYIPGATEASNLILSGTQTAFLVGSARTQTAGRLFQVNNGATAKFFVNATTGITIADGLIISAGGIVVTGNSTITGTLGVSGVVTASTGIVVTTGGVTITAGGLTITAGGLTITAGTVIMPVGSVNSIQTELSNTTDDSVTGTTMTLIGTASGTDFTFTITPASTTSLIVFILQCCPSIALGNGAAADRAMFRVQNTTAAATVASVLTQRQNDIQDSTAGQRSPLTLIGYDTGRTGAQTYQAQMALAAGGGTTEVVHLNGDEVTARFMAYEIKF